jgi:CRP-like cAMP-binding protein
MSVLANAVDQKVLDNPLHVLKGFGPLSDRDRQVIDTLDVKRIGRHQDILVEGDKPNGILFLKEGWAYRYRLLGDGRRHIINFLIPGDLIAPLFPTANHFVGALTEVVVCRATAGEMDDLERTYTGLPAALQGVIAYEFEMLLERTVSLGRRNAKERMANLLVELYQRMRRAGLAGDGAFDFPVTQEMLADALGLSVVHVNRTLRSLREDGMVTVWSGRVTIGDLARLMALAGIDDAPSAVMQPVNGVCRHINGHGKRR